MVSGRSRSVARALDHVSVRDRARRTGRIRRPLEYAGSASRDAPPDRTLGPRPLVLLSPGFAIGSGAYAWLAEHLASHGFVVIALEHREALDPDGLWRATVDRPRDVAAMLAALDASPPERLAGLIDLASVAVIGHSYGGYTALGVPERGSTRPEFEAICDAAAVSGDPVTFLCDALRPHLADMAARAGVGSVPATLWPSSGERPSGRRRRARRRRCHVR